MTIKNNLKGAFILNNAFKVANEDLAKVKIQKFINVSETVDLKKLLESFFPEETVKRFEEEIFKK